MSANMTDPARAETRERRSEVIEAFINIEMLMNCIISRHYFKEVDYPFLIQVLYDEYFSFGLRRRILEKIVPDDFELPAAGREGRTGGTEPWRPRLNDLNRLNTIRNYFAHCGLEVIDAVAGPALLGRGAVINPRRPEEAVGFEGLYQEFQKLQKPVIDFLVQLFERLGGKIAVEGERIYVIAESGAKDMTVPPPPEHSE